MSNKIKTFDQWSVIKTFGLAAIAFLYCLNLTSTHIIDNIISKSFLGDFFKDIYQACKASDIASGILLVTYIFCIVFIFAKCIGRKTEIIFTSIVLITIAFWIGFDDFWVYPSVSGWPCDFKWWLIGGLSFIEVAILITNYKNRQTTTISNHGSNCAQGFSPVQQYRCVDPENNSFVDKLIDKLKKTNVNENAFSLGIVGEWGAGKTAFINSIHSRLEKTDKETVMVFNPWLGITDQSLVPSFFSSLSKKIKEDITAEIESPLMEYADALVAIEGEGGIISKVLSIFGLKNEKNIYALKERISDILKSSQRNIYILIDDLDRLSGEELFEVLRLIRITADFPHIFYITAYDRTYVETALAGYGIDQSKRYLDKIFNLEVPLPKATTLQLNALFKEEIKTVDSSIDDDTVKSWAKWAIYYLPTFRDIKRFIREYSLVESHMADELSDAEYVKKDLFLLELLKYHNNDVYKKLSDHPDHLLSLKLNSEGAFWFEIPTKESEYTHILPKSQMLLKELFKEGQTDLRSIKYAYNFQRYFTYRLRYEEIRREDFQRWVAASDDEAKTIFASLKQQSGNRFSLLFHLSSLSREQLSTSKLKDITIYLLTFLLGKGNRSNSSRIIMYSILRKTYSNPEDVDIDAFFEWLGTFLASSDLSFIDKGKLLKLIRSNCDEAASHIRTLEKSNFNLFLNTQSPNAADIAHHGSTLKELYKNSIEWRYRTYDDPDEGREITERVGYSSLFDSLIEYFQEHPSDLDSKKDLYESMFCFPVSYDDGITYMEECLEEDATRIANEIFGSYDNYKEYYDKAFR